MWSRDQPDLHGGSSAVSSVFSCAPRRAIVQYCRSMTQRVRSAQSREWPRSSSNHLKRFAFCEIAGGHLVNQLAGKTTTTTQSAMPLHSLSAFNVGHCAVTRGSNHFVRGCAGFVGGG